MIGGYGIAIHDELDLCRLLDPSVAASTVGEPSADAHACRASPEKTPRCDAKGDVSVPVV
jgi:hypothetical protein